MSVFANLRKELKSKADSKRAKNLQRFFKTGKGEYGEGDVFLGLTVPQIREICRKYPDLKLAEIGELLKSKFHEERLAALLILVHQFQDAMISHSVSGRDRIFKFYLKNAKRVNNWDLVDLSAPKIVGAYLLDKNRNILYKLAKSKNIWERRIAVLATAAFIKEGDFKEILKISEMLLNDRHDLIHKAVGWMLREVGKPRNVHRDALRGKRSQAALEKFLNKYSAKMPRTMLRYAIERLPEIKRKIYLKRDS